MEAIFSRGEDVVFTKVHERRTGNDHTSHNSCSNCNDNYTHNNSNHNNKTITTTTQVIRSAKKDRNLFCRGDEP